MNVQRVHLVAGFGQIHWMGADEYLLTEDQTQAIAQSEFSMIEHMNEDHSDLLDLYAARILERSGYGWRLTGIDPEGFDLRYEERLERIPFPEQLTEPDSIKMNLSGWQKRAGAGRTALNTINSGISVLSADRMKGVHIPAPESGLCHPKFV